MARTEVTGRQIRDKSVSLADDVVDTLPVANGGTGTGTLSAGGVLVGSGTDAVTAVSPGTSGHVLTSNGSAWVSAAPSGEVTLNGSETLYNKQLVSPTVVGAAGTDVMTLKLADGSTVFTFNQYGELVSQVGYGVHYDSNVNTTAFSTYGPLFLTSGKGSADDHDVTIAPSGAGKINLSGTTEVGGVPVVTTTDAQTLTGKTISGADNSISAIPQSAVTSLVGDLAAKEDVSNKGSVNGYAALDETGKVPLTQVPTGVVVDGVQVSDDAFQLLSGETPVGDPISLLVSNADGGTPYTTSLLRIDGGRLA